MSRQAAWFRIVVIALLSFSSSAAAQDSANARIATVAPGTRIRYRVDGRWAEGRLVSVTSDTIAYVPKADSTRVSTGPVAGFDNLQYARGRNIKLGWGVAIGGLVGAGLGIVSVVLLNEMGGGGATAGDVATVVAIPTLGGALLGAGVSVLVAGTKWHPVNEPPKVQPIITPTPRGMGMGISLRF